MTVMARTSKKTESVEEPNKMPIAYFTSLEVENVLCFKDSQVLDLSDKNGNPAQWTVILGDNGVGKTTLLRCLAGMETRLNPYLDYKKKRQFSLEPLLLEPSNSPLIFWSDFDTLRHEYSMIDVTICCGTLLQKNVDKNNLAIEKGEINVTVYELLDISDNAQGLECYGYGAMRTMKQTSLHDSFEKISELNSATLFIDNLPLMNAEEWLLQADYAIYSSQDSIKNKLRQQFQNIQDILKKILPDIEDIKILGSDSIDELPTVKFLTPYGWVKLNSLGLGYRTMIAWMVDLVIRLYKRYPESDDPLSEPAIVLVDEIDLHLHPKWQRTIMDFLTKRFQNTQFIVTAHSPLVVQAAQDANIVLLRREGDRVVIDNNPEIIDNWRVDQILTSLFELPSARSASLDPLLKRREEILTKPKLTPKDKAELKAIAEQIGHLPTGETPEDIQAMDIIRRAAKLLETQQKSDSHS
jgi:ABC-type cobalamin/Fe3+-siderophores transport system ATPase subunit